MSSDTSIDVLYCGTLGEEYHVQFPALGGLVHTKGERYYHISTAECKVTAVYGRLMWEPNDQPSFWFRADTNSVWIYADDSVVTRNNGPAIMYANGILAINIYCHLGVVNKIVWVLSMDHDSAIDVMAIDAATRKCTRAATPAKWNDIVESINNGDAINVQQSHMMTMGHCDCLTIERLNYMTQLLGTNIPDIMKNCNQISRELIQYTQIRKT